VIFDLPARSVGEIVFWLILTVYLQGTDSKLAVPFPPLGPYSTSEDCYEDAASFAAEIQEKNSKLNVTAVCGVEKNTEQKG
jgi:hypothetical protein